jgi:hypothetical protein
VVDPQDAAKQPSGIPGAEDVGFLEYATQIGSSSPNPTGARSFDTFLGRAHAIPDERRAAGEINANTARTLRSVWVAVPNATDAARQAERLGFARLGQRDVKEIGEKGEEVQCGRGTIVFFEAAHANTPLAAYVKQHGLGLFGISVEVADLKTAQRIVQEGTHKQFKIQRSGNHAVL